MVRKQLSKLWVEGSIPSWGTIIYLCVFIFVILTLDCCDNRQGFLCDFLGLTIN